MSLNSNLFWITVALLLWAGYSIECPECELVDLPEDCIDIQECEVSQ